MRRSCHGPAACAPGCRRGEVCKRPEEVYLFGMRCGTGAGEGGRGSVQGGSVDSVVGRITTEIMRARAERAHRGEGGEAPGAEARPRAAEERIAAAPAEVEAAWDALESVRLDRAHLGRSRVISFGRTDPAHSAFDMLRTRLMQALREKGWSRVGITSPTKGCGKTFVAANLAISLARQSRCRTLLMDLDLRVPNLAKTLGIRGRRSIRELLTGEAAAEDFLLRPVPNLAVGLNTRRMRNAAEFLQDPETIAVLDGLQARFAPDVVLYDLPPMLACDDVVGFLPQIDGLLLVIGGGITRADEVSKCERLIEQHGPLLGVIMNRAEDPAMERYTYG